MWHYFQSILDIIYMDKDGHFMLCLQGIKFYFTNQDFSYCEQKIGEMYV